MTGATGFIGRILCGVLTLQGWRVIGLARHAPLRNLMVAVDDFIVTDLEDDSNLASKLAGIDTVVHLAALAHVSKDVEVNSLAHFLSTNCDGTLRLARVAAAAGIRRFVFVSSIGVNGNATVDKAFREEDLALAHDPYAVSKLEAEKGLRKIQAESLLEVVIVRPPLVYGPGNPGNFLRLLRLVYSGLPLPLGTASNRRSMIYVGNLVDALIVCAKHPSAAGRLYLVSDGEDLSLRDLVYRLAISLGRKPRLWNVPPSLLRGVAAMAGHAKDADRLLLPLVVDSSRIRRELGWKPPFTLTEGMQKTAEWFVNRGQILDRK
ncbi:MAG: NAD-dependent epimerase/dehydratase family protein [Burkholderiales bacterium]